jgi:hypothetical protein
MTEVPWRSLNPRVRVLSSLPPLRYDRHDLYHSPYHSPFALPYFVESNNHELVELLYDEHSAGFTIQWPDPRRGGSHRDFGILRHPCHRAERSPGRHHVPVNPSRSSPTRGAT